MRSPAQLEAGLPAPVQPGLLPGDVDAERIRQIFADHWNTMVFIGQRFAKGKICFSFPTLILAATVSE
jgi:hypothetical protein